jgi:tetratricopeptide (TPR) repeat protein
MLWLILLTFVPKPALSAQVQPTSGSAERWSAENEAGQRALDQGRLPEAIRAFQTAIAEAEKLGWADQRIAGSIIGLAQSYLLQGNYAASESLFQRSLGILEKALRPEDPAVAGILNNLATVYRLRGNYADATTTARRALASENRMAGTQRRDWLNNLALILRLQGDYDGAAFCAICVHQRRVLGPEHPNVAISLNNLVRWALQNEATRNACPPVSLVREDTDRGLQSRSGIENAAICQQLGKYDNRAALPAFIVRAGAPSWRGRSWTRSPLFLTFLISTALQKKRTRRHCPGWNEGGRIYLF